MARPYNSLFTVKGRRILIIEDIPKEAKIILASETGVF
jgi:hypothetical protein